MDSNLKVIGVSGGNGVMLYPFRKNLVANFEKRSLFSSQGEKQWFANFECPKYGVLDATLKDVDIVIGHPDCGDSSILRYSRAKKLGAPKKNLSLIMFFNAIELYQPKLFLFENLPALLKTLSRQDLKAMFPGYKLLFHTRSVSDFGNSQKNRERLIMVGIRLDLPEEIWTYFRNVKPLHDTQTCGELLEGLWEENIPLGHVRESLEIKITLYAGYKATQGDIRNEWMNGRKDKKRWETPHKNFSTAPGVYRNLKDSFPATVRKGNREFNHEGLMMTPRERARIQGIPDTFKIYFPLDNTNSPKTTQYWINKGRTTVTKCPPYEIGQWFYKKVKKLIKKGLL